MQHKTSMDLVVCNSEDRFSLDEIVQAVSSAYEEKAFGEILKLLLGMIQEIIIGRILSKSPDAPSCCGHGHLSLNGHYRRRIRTSLGDIELHVKKVKCSVCGKSFVPLLRHVNVGKYQTKSNEFEQLVVETVSETSYRRGMEQLTRDGRNAPPFRTANGWTLQTDCDEIPLLPDVCGVSPKADASRDDFRQSSLKICNQLCLCHPHSRVCKEHPRLQSHNKETTCQPSLLHLERLKPTPRSILATV